MTRWPTILMVLTLWATTALADWSNDVWSGQVTAEWASYGTLPRLKSVITSTEFSAETNQVLRFHILSTYYGSKGADDDHTVRQMLIAYLPVDRVNAHQFRVLTGDGDPKRVSLAVNSLLRYGAEMFQEQNLSESMRINALYLLFLSFGSTANLNLADTSYANDVFANSGGSLKTMRATRARLLEAATLWNKRQLAAEGKSFVGPGKLVRVNALVASMNTGSNWVKALGDLGVSVDEASFEQCALLALQVRADIAGGGVVNEPRRTLLEVYLGAEGYNDFVKATFNK